MKRSTLAFLAIFTSLIIVFFSAVSAKATETVSATETSLVTVEPSDAPTESPTATVEPSTSASSTESSICLIPEGCAEPFTPPKSTETPCGYGEGEDASWPCDMSTPGDADGSEAPSVTPTSKPTTTKASSENSTSISTETPSSSQSSETVSVIVQPVVSESEQIDTAVVITTPKLADTGSPATFIIGGIAVVIFILGFITMMFGFKKDKK